MPSETPKTLSVVTPRIGRRTQVTPELRLRIAALTINGESITSISHLLGLSKTTVSTIVHKFLRTGQVQTQSRGGNHRTKLRSAEQECIRSWVDDNCLLTLSEIASRVNSEFGIQVSISSIDRCLKGFHYTLKSVLPVPVARNTERTINLRFEYTQMYRQLEPEVPIEPFIFIDEVGSKVSSRRKKARVQVGTRETTSAPFACSRNISVIAAMTKERYCIIEFMKGL